MASKKFVYGMLKCCLEQKAIQAKNSDWEFWLEGENRHENQSLKTLQMNSSQVFELGKKKKNKKEKRRAIRHLCINSFLLVYKTVTLTSVYMHDNNRQDM